MIAYPDGLNHAWNTGGGIMAWIAGLVVLVVHLVRVPVPGAGILTTAMFHGCGSFGVTGVGGVVACG